MKNPNTKAPKQVRAWLAGIGSDGGKAGSSSDKRRAALVRWDKPGARKSISGISGGHHARGRSDFAEKS
jgi:hypothetical protein